MKTNPAETEASRRGRSFMLLDMIYRHMVAAFLIILFSILMWRQRSSRDADLRCFWLTVISCLLLVLEDILETYTSTEPSLRFWRTLLSVLGYTFRCTAAVGLLFVALPREKRKPVLWIPSLITLLVCGTAFFTDIAFGFDGDYGFYRGPLGYVAFIVPYFYLCMILVNAYRRFAEMNGMMKYLIPGCAVFCLAASVVDALHGGTRLNEAIMISSLFFYIILRAHDNRLDPLTGLQNRQAFYDDCAMYDSAIGAVASLDMNGLKEMNDRFGHSAGDQALVRIAGCMKAAENRNATAYRIGGDEFVFLFFRMTEDAVAGLTGQLREDIAKAGYSISAGCAMRRQDQDLEELIRESDSRMYADKAEYYRKNGIQRRKKEHIYGAGK